MRTPIAWLDALIGATDAKPKIVVEGDTPGERIRSIARQRYGMKV